MIISCRDTNGASVETATDPTFRMHIAGKIEMRSKVPLRTPEQLSMAYTPGVAQVCEAIAAEPSTAWVLTSKANSVAVVTDGTAVLGLGDLGPLAALPVMEGKAMLFKELAGINAWPICLATKEPDAIVSAVSALAPGFGGILLEDISSPRCFDIERRLQRALDIPVFHDDQHGTAIVVLAALINALRVTGKKPGDISVVIVGVGAAGTACTNLLDRYGVRSIIGVDEHGIVHPRRTRLSPTLRAYAQQTNPDRRSGTLADALQGADVVVGLSQAGAIPAELIASMAERPIVFALANPVPEVQPADISDVAAVVATGRSDYPNQINNVLAFPGVFRGVLDVRASSITETMKLSAATAIAGVIDRTDLSQECIVPSVFNSRVVEEVASAVANAALADGVARLRPHLGKTTRTP